MTLPRLSETEVRHYAEQGYVVLPGLLGPEEVAALCAECDRLAAIDTPLIKREPGGAARSIMASHVAGGDTASPAFVALSRLPRILGPVSQLLASEALYVYHSKINVKQAFVGGIYSWHQDFGTWRRDGMDNDAILTVMVMLDDAKEISGALYFVPGSHRRGGIEHVQDAALGALNPWSVQRESLADLLRRVPPVPVLGPAGTAVIFHSQLVHGSGHNMSADDRRQVYLVYNPLAHRPHAVTAPRPEFVCSRRYEPVTAGADDAILVAGTGIGSCPPNAG